MKQMTIDEWIQQISPEKCLNCKRAKWQRYIFGERLHGVVVLHCDCKESEHYEEPTMMYKDRICSHFSKGEPQYDTL